MKVICGRWYEVEGGKASKVALGLVGDWQGEAVAWPVGWQAGWRAGANPCEQMQTYYLEQCQQAKHQAQVLCPYSSQPPPEALGRAPPRHQPSRLAALLRLGWRRI